MAAQGKNIAQSVRDVIGAFDKAVDLVRRIEDRKDVKEDPRALHDLYQSLALGGEVMRNYFEADSKRLGQAYIQGDYQARHQILDILIGLKELVSNLQTIYIDDGDLNPVFLKEAFDVHRLEAGMCLSQLSLRLTANAANFQGSPPAYMSYYGGSPNELHHSPSSSPHSSNGRLRSPTPHEPLPPLENMYKFARPDIDAQGLQPWQMTMMTKPDLERSGSNSYLQYDKNHRRQETEASITQDRHIQSWASGTVFKERDSEELSTRRPSSGILSPEDTALLSPALEAAARKMELPLPGEQDIVRDSYTSFTLPDGSKSVLARQSNNSARPSHLSTASSAAEHYDPDDFPSVYHEQSVTSAFAPLFPQIPEDSRQSVTSYASRAADFKHSTLESVSDLEEFRQQNTPRPLNVPFRQTTPSILDKGTNGRHQPQNIKRKAQSKKVATQHPPMSPEQNQHLYQLNAMTAKFAPMSIQHDQTRPRIPDMHPNRSMQRSPPPPPRSTSRLGPASPAPTSPVPEVPVLSTLLHQPLNQSHATNYLAQSAAPTSAPRLPEQDLSLQTTDLQALIKLGSPPSISRTLTAATTTSQTPSLAPSVRTTTSSIALSNPIPPVPNTPLTLPTEKSPAPLCKGAFRLFVGLTRKAFVVANRPAGLSGMVSYWRCDKCLFEGPMAHTASLDPKKKGKQEKIFDPSIRECNGVRYRWAFLAKSHVVLKSSTEISRSGIVGHRGDFGGFACIFCTAEGEARGWNRAMRPGPITQGDVSSVRSGSSGRAKSEAGSTASNGGGSPTFGNVQSFMEHLQMHREEAGWPCEEMRGRMKAVVGRKATSGEEWEVNFTPLTQ